MSVEWQKLFSLEVKRAYSISNGGDGCDCCVCVVVVKLLIIIIECYVVVINIFKKQFDKLEFWRMVRI